MWRLALLLLTTPALAQPVAQVTGSDGATITLRSDKGPCTGSAMLAVWQPADASTQVQGCWILVRGEDGGGVVLVSFLDGERGTIPAGNLRKVRGS